METLQSLKRVDLSSIKDTILATSSRIGTVQRKIEETWSIAMTIFLMLCLHLLDMFPLEGSLRRAAPGPMLAISTDMVMRNVTNVMRQWYRLACSVLFTGIPRLKYEYLHRESWIALEAFILFVVNVRQKSNSNFH